MFNVLGSQNQSPTFPRTGILADVVLAWRKLKSGCGLNSKKPRFLLTDEVTIQILCFFFHPWILSTAHAKSIGGHADNFTFTLYLFACTLLKMPGSHFRINSRFIKWTYNSPPAVRARRRSDALLASHMYLSDRDWASCSSDRCLELGADSRCWKHFRLTPTFLLDSHWA